MFLPVILLDRWGLAGVIAFAVPNVLGCAAFGYVVRSRPRSEAMVRDHGKTMAWFSLAVCAFHVFFAAFVCRDIAGDGTITPMVIAVPAGLFLVAAVISVLPDQAWPPLAVIVYALSLATAVTFGINPPTELAAGSYETLDLVWLTPVLVMGFLLCPYLDLTFHRALQRSGSPNTFMVFGITFAIMLVVTCLYGAAGVVVLTPMVIGHLAAQGVFTVAAHLREVATARSVKSAVKPFWLIAPLLALGLIAFPDGESTYIRWLVLYGLVFPAYILIYLSRGKRTPRRDKLVPFALLLLVCMPAYELGFLHGREWLLPLPVVLLVVIAVIVRR
jgi:hypothetical protein